MEDDLPTEFDLIVVGTGFTESVIAAAASRVGKNVLHLDPNDFYGTYWASFNLDNIQSLSSSEDDSSNLSRIENDSLAIRDNTCRLKNIVQQWYASEEGQEKNVHASTTETGEETPTPVTVADEWTKTRIAKEFRRFNIDITPKLLFSRGTLVELLISSNICRYAEFRAVDHVTTLLNDELKSVPCSRADVFTTKDMKVLEKRLLMKLLSDCLDANGENAEFKDFEQSTFLEYLKSKKLTSNIVHYVMYAISMSSDKTLCPEGVARTKKFLSSLGRYGNTPFLFPMYGCGEIPQCFCRLCAVFGGVYCLKRSIKQINFDNNSNGKQFKSIQCEHQEIKAKDIVFGHGSLSGVKFDDKAIDVEQKKCGNLSRGIYITNQPIGDESLNKGGGGVNFLKIPSVNSDGGAFVMQLSHFSGTVPKGLYLIHIICENINGAATDLTEYTDKIFKKFQQATDNNENNVPKILWSMTFNIPTCTKCDHASETPIDGLHLTCGPYFELDYDESIAEASALFKKIYPDDEFLPRAPDPEEIIIGDDETITDATAVLDSNIHDGGNSDDKNSDSNSTQLNSKSLQEIIKENIADFVEQIENEEKCRAENSMNEEKVDEN